MSSRSDFTTIHALSSARNGGNNQGIYLVKSKRSGTYYIEKRISPNSVRDGFALREIRAMLQCTGQSNINSIKSWDLNYSRLQYGSIFMQHCELGSLDLMIARYEGRKQLLADEGFLWKVFWDISLGLSYLYTGTDVCTARRYAAADKTVPRVSGWNRLVHRDVKPANIFLTWKDDLGVDKCPYPTAVLGDLGGAVSDADVLSGWANLNFNSGATPAFDPPEAPKYNTRVDVYMLALSVHCLARMKNDPVASRTQREVNPLQSLFKNFMLVHAMSKCLRRDPEKRPAPSELPAIVWAGYDAWRNVRKNDGLKLPAWALG